MLPQNLLLLVSWAGVFEPILLFILFSNFWRLF